MSRKPNTPVLDTGAASRGSGNAGTSKEKTVRQWFVDHDLIESVLYLPEPSGARQTARQGSPKGERGGANQNLFYNTTAPGIVLFLNRVKPRTRQGQVFLVNASQVFEKGDPSRAERDRLPGRAARRVNAGAFINNFIPDAGIDRIVDALVNWKEEEKFSRIVESGTAERDSASKKAEGNSQVVSEAKDNLKKNDYNISPSRYIHTGDAETYRPIAEIVEELKVIELEAKETDKALSKILKQLGI